MVVSYPSEVSLSVYFFLLGSLHCKAALLRHQVLSRFGDQRCADSRQAVIDRWYWSRHSAEVLERNDAATSCRVFITVQTGNTALTGSGDPAHLFHLVVVHSGGFLGHHGLLGIHVLLVCTQSSILHLLSLQRQTGQFGNRHLLVLSDLPVRQQSSDTAIGIVAATRLRIGHSFGRRDSLLHLLTRSVNLARALSRAVRHAADKALLEGQLLVGVLLCGEIVAVAHIQKCLLALTLNVAGRTQALGDVHLLAELLLTQTSKLTRSRQTAGNALVVLTHRALIRTVQTLGLKISQLLSSIPTQCALLQCCTGTTKRPLTHSLTRQRSCLLVGGFLSFTALDVHHVLHVGVHVLLNTLLKLAVVHGTLPCQACQPCSFCGLPGNLLATYAPKRLVHQWRKLGNTGTGVRLIGPAGQRLASSNQVL